MNVIVLGGGIGGLSTGKRMLNLSVTNIKEKTFLAFYLATRNNIPKINLFEASSRLGGWIQSENYEDGYVFESAARTLRPKGITGNTTLELIQHLGLDDKVAPILSDRVAGKFRLTWSRNKINEYTPAIDTKLKALFGSSAASDNESIYACALNMFDKEFADYVISPMVSGICAGDAREISSKFLIKGSNTKPFEPVELYKKAQKERWSFYSLKGGIQTLPNALSDKLSHNENVSIHLNSKCQQINFESDGSVKVIVNNEEVHHSNHLISSLPSHLLAPLIERQHPELANELKAMKCSDVAMVNLHFTSEDLLKHNGFGVFLPSVEKSPVIGIIFDSVFSDMKGTTLTVMLGGEKWLAVNSSAETLLQTSLSYVAQILGISQKPDKFKVNILRNSFPQYICGHYQRLERIQSYIKSKNLSLSLCGQSYDGIGINEVIFQAKTAAMNV